MGKLGTKIHDSQLQPQGLLLVLALALLFMACGLNGDRVAGTSSGVDNPQLTVAFQDSNNTPTRISGTLSLYRQNQNPTLDAQALAQIKVDSNSFVNLSVLDFDRTANYLSVNPVPSSNSVLAKVTASTTSESALMTDTIIPFNLYLRTNDSKGAFITGLSYHTGTKRFTQNDSVATVRIPLTPKPLRKVQGMLSRTEASKGLDRIFIPGTPFIAVVVDTGFLFEDLPEGDFELRLFTAEGSELPIKERLNPKVPSHFTVDEKSQPDSGVTKPEEPASFKVLAGADRTVAINREAFLSADIEGPKTFDTRYNYLWREISGREKLSEIHAPTLLRTPVKFKEPGAYVFEISVSNGNRIVTDTVLFAVEKASEPNSVLLAPRPGDILVQGQPFKVVWQSKDDAFLAIEVLIDGKSDWKRIESGLVSKMGEIETYLWVPSFDLPPAEKVEMRLVDEKNEAVVKSEGTFALRPAQPPPQHR